MYTILLTMKCKYTWMFNHCATYEVADTTLITKIRVMFTILLTKCKYTWMFNLCETREAAETTLIPKNRVFFTSLHIPHVTVRHVSYYHVGCTTHHLCHTVSRTCIHLFLHSKSSHTFTIAGINTSMILKWCISLLAIPIYSIELSIKLISWVLRVGWICCMYEWIHIW